jgi:hypothetical protein
MSHIIIDGASSKYGNFISKPKKTFLDVKETSFEEYSEEMFSHLPDKKNNLNLVGDRVKVLIEASPSPFHYVTGIYGSIANALEIFDNPLFIINTSRIKSPHCSQSLVSFLYYFLQDNNIDYVSVDSEDSVGILIDNYYLFTFGEYPIPNAINKIHNMFLKYVDDKDATPYKKVYVSRKKVNTGIPVYKILDESYLIRIDNELEIENFFKSNGFEIVYPEDFKSLRDQVNYFYSAKTVASISGGGALNLIFMQEGGNAIEIVSPLFSGYGAEIKDLDTGEPANWVIAHHNFFSNISFKRKLNYVGISSPEKKASIALGRIINSKAAMSIIGDANNDNA